MIILTATNYWNWQLGELLGGLGALFAAVTFLQPYIFNDDHTRRHIAELVENRRGITLYQTFVYRLLDFLRKVFGKPLSLQAFSICYLIAFVYPIIFFITAYSWTGGTHEFAGQNLLAPDSSYRRFYLPGITLYVIFVLYLFKNTDRIDSVCTETFDNWFGKPRSNKYYRALCALLVAFFAASISATPVYILIFLIWGYIRTALALAVTFLFAAIFVVIATYPFIGIFASAIAIAFMAPIAFRMPVAIVINVPLVVGVSIGASVVFFLQESYTFSITIVILGSLGIPVVTHNM